MTKIEKALGIPFAELFRSDAKLEPSVIHHKLEDEIKAAVNESTKANSQLMNDIFEKLAPVLQSLQIKHGAEEIVVREAPVEKFTAFFNRLLREPGLSGHFYQLLDEGADDVSLKAEFLREITQEFLSSGGGLAKKTRKILTEILGTEKRAK